MTTYEIITIIIGILGLIGTFSGSIIAWLAFRAQKKDKQNK